MENHQNVIVVEADGIKREIEKTSPEGKALLRHLRELKTNAQTEKHPTFVETAELDDMTS